MDLSFSDTLSALGGIMERAEDVRKHIKVYLLVFAGLAIGTVVTVAASNLQVGVAIGIFIAMVIATLKGSMVAGFFMHLTNEKRLIYFLLGITALLLAVMVFITFSTIGDQVGVQIIPESASHSVH